MNRIRYFVNASAVAIALTLSLPASALAGPNEKASGAPVTTPAVPASLWTDRDIRSLNLIYGSGGKAHLPAGPFKFVKEDKGGSSPKFVVVDHLGVTWKAKLGEETRSETAAARLLWAAGYFTDEDYYLDEMPVEKLPKLKRGSRYVFPGDVVRGVRMERDIKGQTKDRNWSWFNHPLAGTRELNGLRVMMALMNSWDLKTVNNAIYEQAGESSRYAISDLGATFGRTGNPLVRSKSNMRDYSGTKFIQKVKAETVDFHLSSRPFFLTAIAIPNYVTRTRMQGVVKRIPRAHAKWLGQRLGQLSPEQIRDCFRSAGYTPDEVEGFTKVVQARIAALNQL